MKGVKVRRFLATGAAAGVLASSAYAAGPVWAADEPVPEASGVATDGKVSGLSAAALDDAVVRDLGMTPAEFIAAGELGNQAAKAAASLRDVPGYSGTRLQDGRIVVSGSGAELLAEVAVLAGSIPNLAVEDPAQLRVAGPSEAAAAEPQGTELAVSTEQLFQAYVREVGLNGLQAVVSSGGKFVIRTGTLNAPESSADPAAGPVDTSAAVDVTAPAGSGKKSAAEFVSRYANVELDGGAPLVPEEDVPGGVGYITDTGWICSTGFSAFDPAGLPAVLTAGHCASDGAAETADLTLQGVPAGLLGRFGFSQFGGPGNSRVLDPSTAAGPDHMAVTDPGNVGTDIAVVESLRSGVDPLPAASTWGDASQPEPDVKIIGTAEPVVGTQVCRSGRTSGWSCGKVDAVGIFLVGGPAYAADPNDVRAFRGFLSYGVQSSGGDSGGPYVSGNYAVGTHAAGDTPDEDGNVINFAVAATLRESMKVLPGYQLELFLNKPVVSTPAAGAPFEPGQEISGNVPAAPASAVAAGSEVRITLQGQEPFKVPLSADGSWSFPAPQGEGTLRFTAETVNGFSTSGTSSFELRQASSAEPEPTGPASEEPSPVESGLPASAPAPAPAAPVPAPAPAAPAPPATPAPTDGTTAVVVTPTDAAPPADLANTGAAALVPAAGAAAAAIAAGGLLMMLVRRQRQHGTTE